MNLGRPRRAALVAVSIMLGITVSAGVPAGADEGYLEFQRTNAQGYFLGLTSAVFWPPQGIVNVMAFSGPALEQQAGPQLIPTAVMVACLRPPGECSITYPMVSQFSIAAGGAASLEAQTAFGRLSIRWTPVDEPIQNEIDLTGFYLPAISDTGEWWAYAQAEGTLKVVPESPTTGIWRTSYDGTFNGSPLLDPWGGPLVGKAFSWNAVGAVGSFSTGWARPRNP